ncbi:MAG: EamA family transporter, partial [Deltaproteobacteria bacterium]
MDSLAFSLILLSALMHALWNLLVKQSVDKTAYIWWMF